MSGGWQRPGRSGAVLYALAAAVVSVVATIVSRLQIARLRGRRTIADALPPGGIIVISNHTGYADGVLLALACKRMGRPLRLLATGGVFRVPVLGGMLRRLGFIRVDRGTARAAEALSPAADALAAGEAVGLFPEGRITRDPARWPERAKTGAIRLALATGAPIVPVAMAGSTEILDRRHNVRRLLRNVLLRPRVQVRVGAPIDVRRVMNIGTTTEPTAEEIRLAADEVMGVLVRLLADLRGEAAPATAGREPAPV